MFPKVLPPAYQAAVQEVTAYTKRRFAGMDASQIDELLGGNEWKTYAKELADLQLNQLTRQTPAETLYDVTTYFRENGERLLEDAYTWTSRRGSDGRLVDVGGFDAGGVSVSSFGPVLRDGFLGVVFSRSR